jgi:ATP/maltotriose-dependent transcriptional regulator MalT
MLGPVELEELAVAAYFARHDDDADDAWERAHRAWLDAGDPDRAARCAAWLGLGLLFRGRPAEANGWFHRGRRLVVDASHDCAGRAYLLVPEAIERLGTGDHDGARTCYEEVVRIAEQCGDADLLGLGLMGRGEVAVHAGDTQAGLAFLDDAMVSVTRGEVSELMAGLLYCAVLEVCMKVLDLQRGSEWTEAFTRWCDETGAAPYRGQCLVHRSQILQAHGRWGDALSEVNRAESWMAGTQNPAIGFARYQQGELHRLRGEHAAADEAYRRASELGHDPVPGLALLRLAEGRVDAASTAGRRMLEEASDTPARLSVLPAAVEVAVACDHLDTARVASDELNRLTSESTIPYLVAQAAHAEGSVLLAEGDAPAALVALRRAIRLWHELAMPYEQARTQVLVARACHVVGDHDAAGEAEAAARRSFEQLGAVTDLARLDGDQAGSGRTPLTERECEVLRQVAKGHSNRDIGEALSISEHTVARHLQNIFTKIGVSSRAAATAYAYQHGIV